MLMLIDHTKERGGCAWLNSESKLPSYVFWQILWLYNVTTQMHTFDGYLPDTLSLHLKWTYLPWLIDAIMYYRGCCELRWPQQNSFGSYAIFHIEMC